MPVQTTGSGAAIYQGSNYKFYEDTSFVAGDSPVTHDVNADLGRNGTDGWIACDGAGSILVAFTHLAAAGATFGDNVTLKNGETMSLTGLSIDRIKITHSADSAYRIFVQ